MSYQHFKLDVRGDEQARDPAPLVNSVDASRFMHPPIPVIHAQAADSSPVASPPHQASAANANFFTQRPAFQVQLPAAQLQLQQLQDRPPYGSGDSDDGYTFEFASMEAFQAWRAKEEEENMVEFIKGDTHGSKAVPPRFKDHVKLVCARHNKSGRKKYVRKCPERNRKVPSRKIEGEGCPASISYKTYYGTPIVRAMYVEQHSHPTGLENLPFTRRGRKLAEQERKQQQQNVYCRANPVLNGTAAAAVQHVMASKAADAAEPRSQNEPPPMACLEPPSPSQEGSADVIPEMQQQAAFVQGSFHSEQSPLDHQGNHARTIPDSYCTSPTNGHGNCRLIATIPLNISPQLPTAISTEHSSSPPHIPSSAISPTQQSCLSSPIQIHNYQLQQQQYLPSPTTPSSRKPMPMIPPNTSASSSSPHYLSLPSYPPSHFRPSYEHYVHTESPAQAHMSDVVQQSPRSPHTPSNTSVPQYSPVPMATLDEDRWARLETFFQAICVHARAYSFAEPSVAALESALLRLYMEGPHNYNQPEQLAGQTEQQISSRLVKMRATSCLPWEGRWR